MGVGMLRFHELPDDILCAILQETDLSDLFILQLVCKPIDGLIRFYIPSIAPAVAKNTFLNTTPLLLQRPQKYDTRWLAGLIPRYLATLIIDRHGLSAEGSALPMHMDQPKSWRIPATETAGEKLRGRVANGFDVMMKLSVISKDVYRSSRDSISNELRNMKNTRRKNSVQWASLKLGSVKSKAFESVPLRPLLSQHHYAPRRKPKSEKKENLKHIQAIRQNEAIILHRRKEYLLSIPQADIEDFRLMFTVFTACLLRNQDGTPYPHAFKPDFFDWGGNCDSRGHRVDSGESWVNWFILHEGPLVFWRQWCPPTIYDDDRSRSVRTLLLKSWDERGYKQIEAETNAAQSIELFLRSKTGIAAIGGPPGRATDPAPYFREYLTNKDGGLRTDGDLDVDDALDDIPYFIDFRGDPPNK
jgi:F-box domain